MQMWHYRQKYFDGDYYRYQQTYFDHLAQAAETGLFDTLAHPDLVKNESPADWNFAASNPPSSAPSTASPPPASPWNSIPAASTKLTPR